MHRHKVWLPARLTGVTRAPSAPSAPAASLAATPAHEPAPIQPCLDPQTLRTVLAELARLGQEMQTRDQRVLGEVARLSVELGTAIAERLVGAELAANRQRLDRIVRGALERMQAARSVVLRGHPDDLALLERQIAEHQELDHYRDVLSCRPDESFQRGQWKLEADEWFIEWDTPRSLAELRAALIEETFMDD
jgi:flagellar biosynthesis/type III secretory pathway protein FliH